MEGREEGVASRGPSAQRWKDEKTQTRVNRVFRLTMHSACKTKTQKTEKDRERQRRQRKTEKDRERQRKTEKDRERQKATHTHTHTETETRKSQFLNSARTGFWAQNLAPSLVLQRRASRVPVKQAKQNSLQTRYSLARRICVLRTPLSVPWKLTSCSLCARFYLLCYLRNTSFVTLSRQCSDKSRSANMCVFTPLCLHKSMFI